MGDETGMTTPRQDIEDLLCVIRSPRVPIFTATRGAIDYAKNVGEKRELLARARKAKRTVYASWPGEWSSDLFVISAGDLSRAVAALG